MSIKMKLICLLQIITMVIVGLAIVTYSPKPDGSYYLANMGSDLISGVPCTSSCAFDG